MIFTNLVKLLREAEFSHCYILFDEAEKIILAQNPTERRELCDNLRHYFIDGFNENASNAFFKILMTIHPNSQDLLLPHWQSSGLDRFTELGGQGADRYTIFFHPLKSDEMAIALAEEYIKRAAIDDSSQGIKPFTNEFIIQALKRAGGIPGRFLKMLHIAIERAISQDWTIIDTNQMESSWTSMVSLVEKNETNVQLPNSITNLME